MFWVLLSPPYYVPPLSGPPYAGGITWPWHSGTGEHQSEGTPHVGESLSSYQGGTGDRIPTQQLLASQLSGELCFRMSQNRVQPWALAAGSLDAGSSANTTACIMEHPEHAAAGAFLLVCSAPVGQWFVMYQCPQDALQGRRAKCYALRPKLSPVRHRMGAPRASQGKLFFTAGLLRTFGYALQIFEMA